MGKCIVNIPGKADTHAWKSGLVVGTVSTTSASGAYDSSTKSGSGTIIAPAGEYQFNVVFRHCASGATSSYQIRIGSSSGDVVSSASGKWSDHKSFTIPVTLTSETTYWISLVAYTIANGYDNGASGSYCNLVTV